MNKKILAIIIGATVAVAGLLVSIPNVQAACDNVSIIRCGVSSEQELRQKYNADNRDAKAVYQSFGIESGDLNGFVDGTVYRDGRVEVDGKTVATNAVTAGYNWGEGDPNRQSISGTEAYSYSTSELVSDARRSMVKMEDGQFKFAVIYDCGNPVKATPVPAPKPKPTPVKNIKVCEVTTQETVTIKEDEFDQSKHSRDYEDCVPVKPVEKTKKVCDMTTNKIVTIKESDYDSSRHTTDLDQCERIKVCRLSDKSIVTIARSELNDKYSTDLEECKEVPVTPPASVQPQAPKPKPVEVLPETGTMEFVSGSIGMGSVAGAGYYYLASRRRLF